MLRNPIETPWLGRDSGGSFYARGPRGAVYHICTEELRRYFHVPPEATRIQFVLHPKPAKGRTCVSCELIPNTPTDVISTRIRVGRTVEYLILETRKTLAALLVRKWGYKPDTGGRVKFYIELFYEI